MQDRSFIEVFPALLKWPPTVSDIRSASLDVTSMVMGSAAQGMEMLGRLTKLESLWCLDIEAKAIKHITSCTSLRSLFIEFLKVDSLSWIDRLENLTVLSIERSYKVESLAELTRSPHLECLRISNFKNVHEIKDLSTLRELRQLVIEGGMYSPMKLDTLKPLSTLKKLEYLNLSNLRSTDKSIKPLGELVDLKLLDISNSYPMEEFAWLSGKLKNTVCTWFKPYIDLNFGFCKKCGQTTMVMRSGKGASMICKYCDANKLAKHVERFNEIASKA